MDLRAIFINFIILILVALPTKSAGIPASVSSFYSFIGPINLLTATTLSLMTVSRASYICLTQIR